MKATLAPIPPPVLPRPNVHLELTPEEAFALMTICGYCQSVAEIVSQRRREFGPSKDHAAGNVAEMCTFMNDLHDTMRNAGVR